VSLLEIPPFEALTQGTSPYSGFGPLVTDKATAASFDRVVSEAVARISETFGLAASLDEKGVAALEGVVSRMWDEGWDPEARDVNLFVRDLGSAFMAIIQARVGGEAVFRSQTDLSHASLWWPQKRLEVFPFHKMYRRLIERDGESLTFFVEALASKLAS
jgi:hypothetical protein